MPIFSYQAKQGRETVDGKIVAANKKRAEAELEEAGMRRIKLSPSFSLKSYTPVSSRDRVFFFQKMALLLSSMTEHPALRSCKSTTDHPRLAEAIDEMHMEMEESGVDLYKAMQKQRKYFPPLACKMIENVKMSGNMRETLVQLAEFLKRSAEFREKLITSLMYPCMILVLGMGMMAFLILKVMPKLSSFFEQAKMPMPASTRLLFVFSNFLLEYGLYLLGFFIVAVSSVVYIYVKASRGRRRIDGILLRLPFAGRILSIAAMSQMCRSLHALLSGNVPLQEALVVVSGSASNHAIGKVIRESENRYAKGDDLATALNDEMIPPLVQQMVATVGGQADREDFIGKVKEIFANLAEFYDHQLDVYSRRFLALLEPMLILSVASTLGFVYFSIFRAINQMPLLFTR